MTNDLTYGFLRPSRVAGDLGRLGGYRVRRLLGAGGMGLVFDAVEESLGRAVALKVLKPELAADPESRARFGREARAAARVPGDHAVPIYAVGEADGLPYLAMERLAGEPFEAFLRRHFRADLGFALLVARQAASGLAAAHELGLVHRDVKPANLWLEADAGGRFKRVRLLDFGLARAVQPAAALTAAGMVVGTPNYMAPEQASNRPVDGRADLFALGCVLHRALTGELAFDGEGTLQVLMSLATHQPPAVRVRNPAVPGPVSEFIARLLSKDPAGRPQSAAAAGAELDELLVPLRPVEPPPVEREVAADTVPPLGPTVAIRVETERMRAARAGPSRRRWLRAGAGGLAAAGAAWWLFSPTRRRDAGPVAAAPSGPPVRVGVLHSLTGTMAVSEQPVVDACLLAVDEVNAAGGVLGRPVEAVLVDGQSDPAEFARGADRLLRQDKVAAVFGCWTSASRKAVKPVVERAGGLLFYPVQYEGLERSPRIVYLGPAPNQQLLPAVDFLVDTLGKRRLFLVGSDYVFPRAAHAIMRDRVARRPGVEVVGERFLPLGTGDVAGAAKAVADAAPDAVLNTINGGTNFHFFRALRAAGVAAARVPTLSVSVTENELKGLDLAASVGDYLAASYFQSVDTPASRAFVAAVRERFGRDRVASDMMAAAYTGVKLWAAAAHAGGSVEPSAVLAAVRGREVDGPGGRVRIDPDTHHAWLPVRVGRVRADGQLDLVGGSDVPLRPEPYPDTRTPAEWDRFLLDLFDGWGGRWQAPA